jgi:ubiquinone/menaquinone biosynthesis C-methylase UbiE
MPNVFDPRNLHHLDNPERKDLIPPHDTLILMGLKPGQVFVDIGAGAGYFSIPASEITGPDGHIIATDLSEEMLGHLKKNVKESGAEIEIIHTTNRSIPLPDHIADMTFMAFVFHELDNRDQYIRELSRITRPEGTIVIIDWAKVDSPAGPPVSHRIDIQEAISNMSSAGCKIESNGMLNPYQYFITARPA